MKDNKLMLIVNGKGGVGKDTLCHYLDNFYKTRHASSITPIKEIAVKYGYREENKNHKSRKFLADLKQAFVDWNDLPTVYLFDESLKFFNNDEDILFIYIREGQEIDKFKSIIDSYAKHSGTKYATLLIKRDDIDKKHFGNYHDDNVANYTYDYTFNNNDSVDISTKKFLEFVKSIIENG